MSIKLMSAIWHYATDLKGNELLTLLALADFANDRGECWPGIATLAQRIRASQRAVQYILADLQIRPTRDNPYLTIISTGGGRGNQTVYRIQVPSQPLEPALQTPQHLRPLPTPKEKAQSLHPSAQKGPQTLQPSSPNAANTGENRAKTASNGAAPAHESPTSINRQEPSIRTTSTRTAPIPFPKKVEYDPSAFHPCAQPGCILLTSDTYCLDHRKLHGRRAQPRNSR